MGRRYIEPKPQIHFMITVNGALISGHLIATGQKLPAGYADAYLVHMPHEPPMQITFIDGQWRMLKVAPEIVKALSEWLEEYYR